MDKILVQREGPGGGGEGGGAQKRYQQYSGKIGQICLFSI